MSNDKFSPQLLRAILKAEGVESDGKGMDDMPVLTPPGQPSLQKLAPQERKDALRQLASLISQFRSLSVDSDELMSFHPEEMPNLLRLLAELATEVKEDEKNREEKIKVLHVAAAMLRRMLHGSDTSHYRVMGLPTGATPAQISEHYQLLYKLFWFDEAVDPQRKSRLRISEAYTVLKEPELRRRYDEDLARLEQTRLAGSERRRKRWPLVAAVLLAVSGVTGLLLFSGGGSDESDREVALQPGTPEEEVVSSLPEKQEKIVHETEPLLPDAFPGHTAGEDAVLMGGGTAAEDGDAGDDVETDAQQTESLTAEQVQAPKGVTASSREVETSQTEKISEQKEPGLQIAGVEADSPELKSAGTRVETEDKQRYEIARTEPIPAAAPALNNEPALEAPSIELPSAAPPVISPATPQPRFSSPREESKPEAPSTTAMLSSPPSGVEATAAREPDLVVIGSPELSVDELTKEQVRAIFLGEKAWLPTGERVAFAVPRRSRIVDKLFYQGIVGKSPRQLEIHWAKLRFQGKQQPPDYLPDEMAVKEAVISSPGMIGIVKSDVVDDSVKVLLTISE